MHVIVPALTAVGDTDEEQARWRELARMQIAFYGSTPNYGFIFDQIGYEGTTEKIRHHQKAGAVGEMARVITDDILDHFVVTATWGELGRKLVERYGGRADRVVAYFAAATWAGDHDAFARWAEVTAGFNAAASTRPGSTQPARLRSAAHHRAALAGSHLVELDAVARGVAQKGLPVGGHRHGVAHFDAPGPDLGHHRVEVGHLNGEVLSQ